MNDGQGFLVRVTRNSDIIAVYGPTTSPVTIGRTETCPIRLDDGIISREHALLELQADSSVLVRDVNGRNGIFLNGKRIKRRVIGAGDTVDLGGGFGS